VPGGTSERLRKPRERQSRVKKIDRQTLRAEFQRDVGKGGIAGEEKKKAKNDSIPTLKGHEA